MFGSIGGTLAPDSIITVFGQVNAKNSFGGDPGMQPYMAFLNRRGMPARPSVVVGDIGRSPQEQQIMLEMCSRRGIAL